MEDRKTDEGVEQQLRMADRMATIGSLAAGVAHEINNPLTYVLANLAELQQQVPHLTAGLDRLKELLGQRHGAEEARSLLREAGLDAGTEGHADLEQLIIDAVDGARRVQRCVADLRTFSLTEEEEEQDRLWIHEVMDSVINMARSEIRYRATVVREYGEILPVKASPGRLSQVFLNLVLNAAQAMEEGRVDENQITLKTCMDGGDVVLEVDDTGCGIPPENMQRLMDPFFTTQPVGQGAGMGLTICHNVVSALGGSISVQSRPGHGTRVVVRLPASEEDEASRKTVETPLPTLPVRGRILVVDDEPHIREALKRLLSHDHEVVEVDSGDGAQALLRTDGDFDLVLCDLMMKQGSGMDLHRWMEESRPDLADRTLFLSGGGVTSKARAFLNRMKERSFAKPLDIPRLLARIQHMLTAQEKGEDEDEGR